jgi:hypothetical protein
MSDQTKRVISHFLTAGKDKWWATQHKSADKAFKGAITKLGKPLSNLHDGIKAVERLISPLDSAIGGTGTGSGTEWGNLIQEVTKELREFERATTELTERRSSISDKLRKLRDVVEKEAQKED